jgi:hypothetical protein
MTSSVMFDRSRQERAQVFEGADANPDEIRLSVVTIDEHGSHACCSAAGNVPVELVANEPALVAAYGEPRARVLEDALRRLAPADMAAQTIASTSSAKPNRSNSPRHSAGGLPQGAFETIAVW